MSEVYHGVILSTDESTAHHLFDGVKAKRPLHLVQLSVDTFGFYSQPGNGSFERLQSVAATLSQESDTVLFYGYDSRVGFICEMYLFGDAVDDPDLEVFFDKIKEARLNDEIIESAFHWDAFTPISSTEPLSKMYLGVIIACDQLFAQSLFESIDSFLRLRLARLAPEVFVIYPGAPQLHPDYFGTSEEGKTGKGRLVYEMCRIAEHVSTSCSALWRFWDSCLGEWTQLYVRGTMETEIVPKAQGVNGCGTIKLLSQLGISAHDAHTILGAIADGAIDAQSLGLLENHPLADDS